MTGWPPAGVARMVRFNWPEYALAVAVIAGGAGIAARAAVAPIVAAGWVAAGLAGWWLAASFVAGWLVYDRSPLYAWRWATSLLARRPDRWLNVTVGFDESTVVLRDLLGPGDVVDVYDPGRMTETSIRRARASRPAERGTVVTRHDRLPYADRVFDVAFLVFAAHELRERADRAALFGEIGRILRPGGELLLVEHPRSPANVAAFGPGAMHFLPRGEWLRLARHAGLAVVARRAQTPFVEALCFRRLA